MKKLPVIEVGDELGVILPPDTLERLGWAAGDTVVVSESVGRIHLQKLSAPASAPNLYRVVQVQNKK